ncbi:hypothetical protein CKO31_24760 [Thiohalocapsa halophila]|uniref:Uncharacterized protein n=1 Tax=Thiohalocapsa halophila TaxID=69359 RepID=A0ABS1CPZ9_9GAMM|nr:hypothetical protein [Thiohalocapsa halophila]
MRMPLQSLKQRFVFGSSRHRRLLVSAIYRSILANNISTVRTRLVSSVAPLMDELQRQGFRLSARTRGLVLRRAGEA